MHTIPYARQYISSSDIKEVAEVLNSEWITQGAKVGEFEKKVSRYCGAKYAVAVSSGTAALHLACSAMGLGKNDEVITTPMTFLATSNAVLYTGARPVFADIDDRSGNIDPAAIKKKITSRTRALLPVHFAGLPCNMSAVRTIAQKRGLMVIEDACHALGAEYKYKGRCVKVGSCRHSEMAVFSFHPVKTITTGEGGAITTNSKKLYEKLCALRRHGVYKNNTMNKEKGPWYYEMRDLGFNYRITDFQCALGISQLKRIDTFIKRRKNIVKIYEKELRDHALFDLPQENIRELSAWHLYPLKLKNHNIERKKKIYNKLQKLGIRPQVHYIPVHMHAYYRKHFGYKIGDYPVAEDYYARTLSIPLYPKMSNKDVYYVVECLKSMKL